MNILRDRKKGNYTMVPNTYLRDKTLSLKAKGLMTLIVSLPENWEFSVRGLAEICRECKDTVRAVILELEQAGYLRRSPTRRDNRFDGWRYEVYPQPQAETEPRLSPDLPREREKAAGAGAAPRGKREAAGAGAAPREQRENTREPLPDAPSANALSANNPPANFLPTNFLPAEASSAECSPQLKTYQEKKDQKPPQSPSGGRCARPKKARYCPERFDAFWESYPRHEDRQSALRAWDALRPGEELFQTLMDALRRQQDSDAWRRGIGIPYAGRWLTKQRWEDEPMASPQDREREWDMGYIPQDIQLVW